MCQNFTSSKKLSYAGIKLVGVLSNWRSLCSESIKGGSMSSVTFGFSGRTASGGRSNRISRTVRS